MRVLFRFVNILYCFCSVVSQSLHSLFQQANGDPQYPSRQLVMHHESLYGGHYDKGETLKISDNFDFGPKFIKKLVFAWLTSHGLLLVQKNEENAK